MLTIAKMEQLIEEGKEHARKKKNFQHFTDGEILLYAIGYMNGYHKRDDEKEEENDSRYKNNV
jgi:hypothetical protein